MSWSNRESVAAFPSETVPLNNLVSGSLTLRRDPLAGVVYIDGAWVTGGSQGSAYAPFTAGYVLPPDFRPKVDRYVLLRSHVPGFTVSMEWWLIRADGTAATLGGNRSWHGSGLYLQDV